MATRPFIQSKYGKLLHQTLGSRKPTVGTMGESHGRDGCANAIALACFRYYHADIVFDHRDYSAGGTMFAMGGTTTTGTNGLTTQATWFAARPTDIVFIASGYNDAPTNLTAPTIATTVQTVAEQCFTAGAQVVVIVGITNGSGTAVGCESYNTLMQNWSKGRPGAIFLDVTSIMTNHAAASGTMAYRLTGTVQNSMTFDGTHWSLYLCLLLAPHFANVFRGIAPERVARTNFNAGAYDPSTKPWINLLGDAGNCLGTAGVYNSGLDTGVAGTGAASRLEITPSGSGPTSTNSIVTGTLGERKQRMVVAGALGTITVACAPTITNVNNSDATRRYDYECVVDLTSFTGFAGMLLIPTSSTYISPNLNNDLTALWPDSTTATQMLVYSLYPFPASGNNPNFQIIFNFAKAPAGTIEISRLSAMRVV